MASGGKDVWYFDDFMVTGWPKDVSVSAFRYVKLFCQEDSDAKKVYIGMATGGTAVQAMKRRHGDSDFDKDINAMIALYKSESQDNCTAVKAILANIFQSHKKVINKVGGAGGNLSDTSSYYVFVGLQIPSVFYWEDMQSNFKSLEKHVAQYCQKENVEKFYIGMTSGEDVVKAMRQRYDEFKSHHGINAVVALYETQNDVENREFEEKLVARFRSHEKNINRIGGGGGRPSSGPNYYIYLALRITPCGH